MSATATLAPWAASARAIARPIPRAAPVITHARPEKSSGTTESLSKGRLVSMRLPLESQGGNVDDARTAICNDDCTRHDGGVVGNQKPAHRCNLLCCCRTAERHVCRDCRVGLIEGEPAFAHQREHLFVCHGRTHPSWTDGVHSHTSGSVVPRQRSCEPDESVFVSRVATDLRAG